jgi:hypothetical protein
MELPFEIRFLPCKPPKVGFFELAHRSPHYPSWTNVKCPHWTRPMCFAISFVLMTTLVELWNISRWNCWSTPRHLRSLCNGPKSWNNVSWPTCPFHELVAFTQVHSTFCFQMQPTFHLALGLFQL